MLDCSPEPYGLRGGLGKIILLLKREWGRVNTLPHPFIYISFLLVALGQLLFEVGEREAHLLGEHEEVVEEVASFVEVALAIAVDGFDDGLNGFFAHLLGYLVHALIEEVGGVGAFGHLGVAVLDAGFEGTEEAFVVASVEARHRAAVAGGAIGARLDEQGVAIAIAIHLDHVEEVAAGLALGPQGLAGAAIEGDTALGLGLLEGFLVHVAEHQHLEAVGILYDDGKQSVGCLTEVEILEIHIYIYYLQIYYLQFIYHLAIYPP